MFNTFLEMKLFLTVSLCTQMRTHEEKKGKKTNLTENGNPLTVTPNCFVLLFCSLSERCLPMQEAPEVGTDGASDL